MRARVAILWGYEAAWSAAGPATPSALLDYADAPLAVHRALRSLHVAADVVAPETDLTSYDVVVVPTLVLVSDVAARAVAAAAERGAHVLVTYFSGIVDEADRVRLGGYPGAFRELLGVRVQEFFPLRAGERVGLDDGSIGTVWSEDLDACGDTEVLARYADAPRSGGPAVTRRAVGDGVAWYVSTFLDDAAWRGLLGRVVDESGTPPVGDADEGVELVRREAADGRSWLFAINQTERPASLRVRGFDLVTGADVDGERTLPPYGVAVVREAR